MTKKDLMTGDIAITRGGLKAVVIRTDKAEYLMFQSGGYDWLDDYTDELTYLYAEDESGSDDIMQVYRATDSAIGFIDFDDEYPIYERDDTWTIPKKSNTEYSNEIETKETSTMNNNNLFIIAQQFYGNRTATEIRKDDIDAFLLGYTSSSDLSLTGETTDRQIVKVPGTDNIVIVYDKNQENETIRDGRVNNISCEIPEIGFKIHTRCFACRIDKNDELQSLEKGDSEKFIKFFIV